MNATSLYVSTCRLVIQADAEEQTSWNDLYRLLPYLRQSLSCTVCDKLLIEPYTPTESSCQHHVCKSCRGMKKRLKPSCSWCKNYDTYVENVQLRILLQCYKKFCEYLASTLIYKKLTHLAASDGTSGLLEIIQEGAGFKDDYKSSSGLTKSAYSILPCVFPVSSNTTANVQTQTQNSISHDRKSHPAAVADSTLVDENPAVAGTCLNPVSSILEVTSAPAASPPPSLKKIKVRHPKQKPKRKGCRCGNATATPGKLTCCGQRCPCYVEAKSCTDCRCRGCRNPHTPGGKKVLPYTTGQDQGEPSGSSLGELSNTSANSLATELSLPPYVHIHGTSTTSLYSNSPLSVEQVPTTLLVDDEKSSSEDTDIDVDI